jgi:hypothetical protein
MLLAESHSFETAQSHIRITTNATAAYIASVILMDAYPAGMHRFQPAAVFKTLFHDASYLALQHCYSANDIMSIQCRKNQRSFDWAI